MSAQNNIELTGSQLLYNQPEALHSGAHGNLRFRQEGTPFANAEGLHLVPLLVGEFAQAMMHYPIVFAGPERTPLAVMGLAAGQNMFFKNGRFEERAYVPAYLRRYPFTLANAGEGSEAEFVVCIDRTAPGFVEDGDGQALFDNGEPTEFTRNAISFLDAFEAGRKHTQEFIDLVEQAGLFDTKNTLFVSPDGQREHVADYFGIAEDRLADLSDEVLGNLVRRGAMTAIHAHLFSLQRWNDLLARRAGQEPPVESSAVDEQDGATSASLKDLDA